MTEASPPRSGWMAVGFAMVFPSVLTFTYFVLLADSSARFQQTVYGIGKFVQFGFPAVWVLLILRYRPQWPASVTRGVGIGLAFGMAIMVTMLLLYFYWLGPNGHLRGLETQVIEKVRDLGIDSVWKFGATAVFYALAHSLLEEYYWRWFVFGQLMPRIGVPWAVFWSSIGFMAHHVILLATYFGWDSPLAYLFSLGVAVGGAVWAWLYAWSRSLLGPWLSHMLIDAAIFLIGFAIVRHTIG